MMIVLYTLHFTHYTLSVRVSKRVKVSGVL